MYEIFTLPKQVSNLLEPVEGKPGFLRLPYMQLCLCLSSVLMYLLYIKHPRLNYISPLVIKKAVHQIRVPVMIDYLERQRRNLERDGWISRYGNRQTETSEEFMFELSSSKHNKHLRISADMVCAIRLLFWPQQAACWINRPRHWPPHTVVQIIVNHGCHLVPRSSPGGDVNSEWRLSFSNPEASLALKRSKEQKCAYYLFKIFFYRYLKFAEPSECERKPLSSYIMKTTMMWACEVFPPGHKIWKNLANSVQMLLCMLSDWLKAAYLPHYFIPEINLLERVGEDVRRQCIRIISSIQNNVLMAVPYNMQVIRNSLEDLNNTEGEWMMIVMEQIVWIIRHLRSKL